ncbi:zinc finger protein 644 isoform X2 [Xiphias gladius]|uniref:zinc finger protein 644 isoform X2 n=1 Tax=Xiphias gladius TaxID=8245 RepID=UPI001A988850|nr:zinc finger protein 644 isoform X2 [Xiphias gladius]
MFDLKQNVQEDKDVESVSDSPGRTQEPLQSHTCSLENSAAGLSSDEHENPLNGTQPNPFVYSSVPAVPHAGNSLPSGALVNGPGSHPTSEVHCVLNKGTVLSNNVLDAAWQVEKDTSSKVLPPPSELQSDAWKNTAGPAVKTLATQPCVSTPLSHSEENESKLAYSTLSGDSVSWHISQPWTKQTMETGSRCSVEWSESSSDDYDHVEVIRWNSARECFLHNDKRLETRVMHQKYRQNNTHVKSMSDFLEKVDNNIFSDQHQYIFNISNVDKSLYKHSSFKYSVVPFRDLSRNTALDSEHQIYSAAQEGCNEENDPEDVDNFIPKVEQLKMEQHEQDPSFFSCIICNVNLKEKRNFHRHMMYHLGKHNQVNSENVSQTFICRECGRLFCDINSLMTHIIIHQDTLEKLMEEIKGLKNTEFQERGNTIQCPQCEFGCNCPIIFVQHAKTQDNVKHYYFCEECNYITLTQQALELHLHVAHLNTHQPQYRKITHTNDAEDANHVQFKMGFFNSRDKVVLERHSELEYQRSHYGNYKKPKTDGCKQNLLKSTFGETAHFPHCVSGKGDIYIKKSNEKTINFPQFKCHVGCTKNTWSPSLWTINKHGNLLLQPLEKLDVATDLTCVEEDAEKNYHKSFGSSKQANCPATADFLLSASNLKLEQFFCQGSKNDLEIRSLQAQANQNSPSERKMSTPLHNTIDDVNGNILPRLSQRHKKHSAVTELEKGCEGGHDFSDDTSKVKGSFFESSENERNPYDRKYFRMRQRFSSKDQSRHMLKNEDGGDEDYSDIEQLIIKEEYIETTVCDNSPESPCTSTSDNFDILPSQVVEHKPCPYCPAMFESGVGLSNHVRGHLHRVGLSYNVRHMVSPEQVALWDHQPRTRRRIPTGMRKMRKAVKPENQGEHTCPLCWDWFDTKTGLSNHVRGHLKRIGRSASSIRECDSNNICIQCNSNFPTAVSLSGHFQDRACRKRNADSEEPGYDYKQKKPRPRPELKKKILPALNAQIYTLTCRFCDLVFQGPLSIQEDWIKHLQRHLLHTNVPHSGTGMLEIFDLRRKMQITMSHKHPDIV